MLSFDLIHPPDYERYYRQVVTALSRVFYSSALIAEVLHFVLHKKPELVVERELGCYGPSKALKVFKNSNLLVSVGEIGVQLWELSTLEQLKWFEIEPMFLCAAIFSDEKHVVVGRDTLDFWDIQTEKRVRQWKHPCLNKTRILALTEDEKILAGANFGKKISLWNVESGELLRTLESCTSYPTIKFSLKDSTLHIVHNGDIHEMNTTNGDLIKLISNRESEVTAIKEYPGSLLFVHHTALSRSSDLVFWDFATNKIKWSNRENTEVSGIFDTGKCLVSGGSRESITLWNSETGRLLTGYIGGKDRSFCRFDISPDRQRLIASTNAGLIMVFNLR